MVKLRKLGTLQGKIACIKSSFLMVFIILSEIAGAQTDIFSLMNRTDLKIDSVEKLAAQHFKNTGTGRGSGYKQYQRWLYERKYHLDSSGYFIPPSVENASYQKFVANQKKYKAGTINWSELGPKSWSATKSWNPGVGRITSVAVHPSDTTKIYVTSPGGGIWKSTNSGASWTPLIDNVNSGWMSLHHICIDPNNQSVLYASLTSGGVIKSTNAGTTWAATGTGPSAPRKVLVQPNNSNVIFAACGNGVWKSTNAGTTWSQTSTTAVEDIEFNPANYNILYASGSTTSNCVLRSSNNGASWTVIGSASGITASGRTLLGVSPNNPAVVYAVQANGAIFGKFYKSTDSGMTYTTLITGSSSAGTNYFGYEPDGKGTTGQATYDMAICVNPANVNEVHIGGIICWKSTNGGSSFTVETEWTYPNATGYNHADIHALEWFKGTIYSGSDGGIFKSVNKGDDWIDLSSGLGIKQVYRIACAPTNSTVIALGAQDNGCTIRQTSGTWKDWLGADGMDVIISPTDASTQIGMNQNGAFFRTTDMGNNFTWIQEPSTGNWVTPICYHPQSHDTVFGGWTGVWKSTNGGTNWTNISSSAITSKVVALAVAPSNPNYIYASIGTTLYRTSNGGSSWSSVTASASINSICVSPSNPSKIWIACNSSSARVFVSTNGGGSFTDISSGLPSTVARSVVVDDNSWEGVYVGMNIGVYYRDNNNTAWVQHGTGLPLVAINEVEIQKSAGKLRVATYGRGVWESNLQTTSSCPAPPSQTVSNITTSGATLSWGAATGAVKYRVQYKASTSSTWSNEMTTTGTSMSLSGLSSGTTYNWQVKTICSTDSSAYSQSSFTSAYPCTAPTGLTVSNLTSNGVTASWTAVTGASGYGFEYKTSAGSTWIRSNVTGTNTKNLSGLTANLAYVWRVKTLCPSDSSGFTQSTFSTPSCTPPATLSTSNITATGATLGWTSAGTGVTYTVEYKLSSTTTWGGSSTVSGTSRSLTGLSVGTAYDWRIRTNCTSGSSAYAQGSFTTVCSAPTVPKTTNATTDSATLSWTAASGVNTYIVEYKLTNSSTWGNTTTVNGTSIRVGNLNAGSQYNWQVKSECNSSSSGFVSAYITTTCPTPTNFVNTAVTTNSASFSWDASRNTTYYIVNFKPSSSSTWSSNTLVFATTYTLTGLSSGVSYDFRMQSKCNANNGAWQQLTFTTNTNCGSPTGLSLAGVSSTGADVKWNRVSGATNYTVEYKPASSSTWGGTTTITDTLLSLTGLNAGTSYDWRVRANCSSGSSAYSQASLGTTCPQPANPAASNITSTSATIAWSAASGIVNYTVSYKPSGSSGWTGTYNTTSTFVNLTGLTPGTAYDWQVKSNCTSYGSSYLTSGFTTDCVTPSGLTVTGYSSTGANLRWNATPGAVNYTYQYKATSSSGWTGTTTTTDTFASLSGLNGGSAYQWQVRTNCSSGISSFAQSGFTTVCDAPGNLTLVKIGYDSAQLSWSNVNGAVSYVLEHRVTGSSSWAGSQTVYGNQGHALNLTPGTAYDWQIKTACNATGSAFVQSNFTTLCPDPVGLYCSSKSSSSATLRWAHVPFVTGYVFEYKTASGSTWTGTTQTTDTFINLSGLNSGTVYSWRVQTLCASGNGSFVSSSFTTTCDLPGGLSVSGISDSTATISWTGVSGAGSYTIEYKASTASNWTRWGSTGNVSAYLSGLNSGTGYSWRVKAYCPQDSSSFSQSTFTTTAPCNAPTGLSASGISASGATVSWTAVSGAGSYTVEYKLSTSSGWNTAATTSATSVGLTGLSGGFSYQWRVRTNCSTSASGFVSASFNTACNAPGGLNESNVSANSALLYWNKLPYASGYSVDYKETSASSWTSAGSVSDSFITVSGLTGGTSYMWRVRSNCSALNSSYAQENFTTACNTPGNLSVSYSTTDSAVLNWNSVSGATNYTVEYKTASSSSWLSAGTTNTTSFVLSGLTNGTSYHWRVNTHCQANSSSATQSGFTTNCSYPAGLSVSGITPGTATVSWNGNSSASAYDLEYKTSASSTWSSAISVSGTSYQLTGLTPGTSYDWRVKSNCTTNSSGYSQSGFTTTSCSSPAGLSNSGVGSNSANLSWNAALYSVGYQVEYKLSGGSGWSSAGSTTDTFFTLSGLTAGSNYIWQVRTVCASGNSSFGQAAFTTICDAPAGFTVSNVGTDSATLSWNSVSGATGYGLEFKLSTSSTWTSYATASGNTMRVGGMNAGTLYNWQIKTLCSSTGSSYEQKNVTTLCPDVSNLQVSAIGTDSAVFSWNAASNALYYWVSYKTSASSTWSTDVMVNGTSYVLKGLSAGTSYDFRVQTKCNANNSGYQTKTFSTSSAACQAPGGLSVSSITSSGATLSWTAASSAVNYTIEYKLSSSSSWTVAATQTGTSRALTGLSVGTAYDWRVKTNCSSGSSGYSQSAFNTLCNAPTKPIATNITLDSATLTWSGVSGAVDYTVEYRLSSASTWTGTTVVNGLSHRIGGLNSGSQYTWQVRSNCSANSSTFLTGYATTPCPDVTNFTATSIGTTSASFSWTAARNAVYYFVSFKTSASSTWSSNSLVFGTTYTLSGLSTGVSYDIRISTKCNANNSAWQQLTFTTGGSCNAPSGLNTTSVTNGSATLRWSAVSGASGYSVEYKQASSSTWSSAGTTTNDSLNISSLSYGTSYDWRVRTNCSSTSSTYAASAFTTYCPPVTGFTGSNTTTDSATLSWNAGGGANNYTLEYKTANSSSWSTYGNVNNTSARVGAMNSGTAYNWQVKANCPSAGSTYLQTNITTFCPDVSGLATSAVTSTSAGFNWSAAKDAVYYFVQYKTNSASNWSSAVISNTNNYSLTGLTPGETYNFRVQTKCVSNNSINTAQITFATPCTEPSNPVTASTTSNSALVRWNRAAGISSYSVEYKLTTSGTWSNAGTVSDSFLTISSLSNGAYDWRVKSNCTSSGSSYVASGFIIYCASKGDSSHYEYIKHVSLGSISRTSGNDNGYYFASGQSTNIRPGYQYTITFAPGFPGKAWTEKWSVFIDYNRNGSFTESGELVGQKTTTDTGNATITFTVPNTASIGNSRLRVSMRYYSFPSSGCSNLDYGEVEDYPVVISTTPGIRNSKDPVEDHSGFIHLYPVPAGKFLQLQYNLTQYSAAANIEITDDVGKVVFQKQGSGDAGSHKEVIDLSDLHNGLYFLSIKTDQSLQTRKFLISK